ncbi:rhomboid family intramembrane serine protease [Phyllobacterium sp. TAF24]|uniref:rhomboid family intramembrane serine protease n=1 Tax=unclassified Phyllobacterium TaxID=2638441 RepID=UPI001587D40B|nr:rhomboid family intramembrane serine protease [Phyllobacterium sp. OV277]
MPVIKSPTPTLILILVCVVIAIVTRLGDNPEVTSELMIASQSDYRFHDIMNGEVWRLFTPIFLHFSPMHLIFNMFWLYDLGGQIEQRIGYIRFIILVMMLALVSNITQYLLQNPSFGGMSGVVYGLFGYVFIRVRAEGSSAYFITHNNVIIMFGWFILCWTNVLGPVANWAHTGGLVLGLALGAVGFGVQRRRRLR